MKWLISSSVEKIKPEYQFSKQERMKDSLFCKLKIQIINEQKHHYICDFPFSKHIANPYYSGGVPFFMKRFRSVSFFVGKTNKNISQPQILGLKGINCKR